MSTCNYRSLMFDKEEKTFTGEEITTSINIAGKIEYP